MSVVNHNAILATTWNAREAKRLMGWIEALPQEQRELFALNRSPINGYWSLCMFPDGSNEGWDNSILGGRLRAAFISEIKRGDYPLEEDQTEPSSPWHFVEVGYGEYGAAAIKTNCSNHYSDEPYCTTEGD